MKSLSHAVAGAFGLTGFAVAGIAGMAAGNSAGRVLLTSVAAMVACNLIGGAMGGIFERLVEKHLDEYRRKHPDGDEQRTEVNPVVARHASPAR